MSFFENIDDFNFVEEFDKIVEECIEVATNEIDKVQDKGIYNDAENVDDSVIAETIIEKELHILICHSGLGTKNTVSQRIQTNMHKIGEMMLQWK